MAGLVRNLVDGLINALTGLGSQGQRGGNQYTFCPLDPAAIKAAYRGSGLLRKVIDIPALDATREWRDWQAEDDQIEALEAEEQRLGIQAKVRQAEVLRGLGGAALILGAAGLPESPLNPNAGKGSLAFVHVASRWQITLGDMVDDPMDPLFGGPRWFEMTTTAGPQKLHPSRVVCFKGDPVPNIYGTSWEEQFWGEGRIQRVLDAVTNSDTAQQSFAALIVKARNTRVGIPKLFDMTSTDEGEARLQKRLKAIALGESMFNWTMYDAGTGEGKDGESITDHQVNWAGIPDVMYAFATFVAAVADIPVTRLLGRAAEGMNASGDSQQKDYNKTVAARQSLELRPCIDQLDIALIPSALGNRPADVWWKWAPLDTPSESEETQRFKTWTEAAEKVQNSGTVPDIAFSKAYQNSLVESGWLPGLEGALAEVPEGERFPEAEPDGTDPNEILNGGKEADPNLAGRAVPTEPGTARRAANDAAPRTLYVRRDVVNTADFQAWAKAQGLPALQDGLHVTIAYSRTPLDWMKIDGEWNQDAKGQIIVQPGGVRIVEPLGDRTAVLLFTSSALSWRHESIVRAGASHDYADYQPHISLTGEPVDLSGVKPYRGKIVLGHEIFEELDEGRM